MNKNTLYEIKDLKRRYGQGFVLDIPYLKIERDKSYGIVGPNGSGKSTLLRILAFIDRQDEGTVWFNQDGHSGDGVTSKSSHTRGSVVTMLLQEPYLLKRSVYENIAYGLRVRGIRKNIREKVNKSLSMVGLDHRIFSHRKWSELSGGEAQRIALAARLVLEPAVLILDEPTASVDRVSAQIIKDTIKKVRKEHMTTLIIAAHDLVWLHEVADEILKMHAGNVMGSGEENFITGPWNAEKDGLWSRSLDDGQKIIVLPSAGESENAILDPTSIIISTERPDHISAQNVLSGRLVHMYTFEHSERVKLDIQVSNLSLTCSVTRKAASSLGLLPGLEVWVVFKASSLQWQ
ncbi:MAG: ATP-binding cassette domain-containing protein [Spirochaetota bacterium]|nr:MAG: ATP-binding cassette domain-containing protein [Spirochaetota bacterium]